MNVFVSETCYRQVYGSVKGSSTRRVDDFNRLVSRLQAARCREDLQVKGLGTKKYRSLGHDVYGVDLNNGLTAERVIFVFVADAGERVRAHTARYALPGEDEGVLLCYCSEHDSQHRNAQLVAGAAAADSLGGVAAALPGAAEQAVRSASDLSCPLRTFGPGDLEHYGQPRTPVLTDDKFRILNDFLARPRPVLVTGAAGSGKTELGLAALNAFARTEPAARLLYLSFAARLVAEVQTRCAPAVRAAATFSTFDELLRRLSRDPDLRFAGAASFGRFVAALRTRPAMGGRDRAQLVRLLDERGAGCVYAEVYGVVAGSMGAGWDRLGAPGAAAAEKPGPVSAAAGDAPSDQGLLSLEDYLALPQERSAFAQERERRAAWGIARAYASWCASAGLASRNAVAARLAAGVAAGERAFDLVVADEVQDLTEVQVELLLRLAGGTDRQAEGTARLLMTGDANQVLSPSGFDARRMLALHPDLALARLEGNFRNPLAVCALANAVGELRAASPRLVARRAAVDAPEAARNKEPGRCLWWVGSDETRLLELADEAANVALVCDAPTWRRLYAQSPSVFTVEQVKGMEFRNVILYGTLADAEARLDALFEPGPKDPSLHRVLNKVYVGVTRSCGNLLVAEPRPTAALRRLVAAAPRLEAVENLDHVDFDLDASARGYLAVGRALKEQGAWKAARANLERAVALAQADPSALTAVELEDAHRMSRACAVYAAHDAETCAPAELAAAFEEAGLPEEALVHARAALDAPRCALLTLASDRGLDGARFGAEERARAFEAVCEREGLDLPDLVGRGHDDLLDAYVRDRADELELLALETADHVAAALANLRSVGLG